MGLQMQVVAGLLVVSSCWLFASPMGQVSAQTQKSTAIFDYLSYQGSDPIEVQRPLQRGQYRNPIVPGFHPDPSIVKVGHDFYLINSSFAFFPGIPIFHSTDLRNWRQIGNAIDRTRQLNMADIGIARGVFAPSISYENGTYYIINTCIDCKGNFIISAQNPAGPWSNPVWLDFDGIDPSLFVDSNGRAWVLNNGPPEGTPLYDGHRAIWMQQIDLERLTLMGPRKVIVNGGVDISKKPIWIEGPHIFFKDGHYYLIAAEGGTHVDHSQTVFRSRNVTGPYQPGPNNPILTQRDLPNDRPFPVQATGHADFVELDDGSWWSVFLGTRPYQGSLTNLGRETFLLPVTWTNGWPSILPQGVAVPLSAPRPNLPPGPKGELFNQWRDSFERRVLGPEYLMLRTPQTRFHFLDKAHGQLVLEGSPLSLSTRGSPAFVARRQRHLNMILETKMTFTSTAVGDRAGLAVFADERHHFFLGLSRTESGHEIVVTMRQKDDEPEDGRVLARQSIASTRQIKLRIRADGPSYSFDFAQGARPWTTLLSGADGTILSTDKAAMFTGTVWGPYTRSAS
jgi:xylan 1,4-beta-xylosidase